MKRKCLFLLMAVALVMGFAACSEENEDGRWPAMKTDKTELHFSIDGGCDTLRLLNYKSWWLSTVVEIVDNRRTDHYMNENPGGTKKRKGDWFSLKVPEEAPNLLVVECDSNANRESRELYITMEFGDAFGTYHVMQDRVPRQ